MYFIKFIYELLFICMYVCMYVYCKYLGEIKLKNLRLKVSCYYNLQVNNDVTVYSSTDVHDVIIFTNN